MFKRIKSYDDFGRICGIFQNYRINAQRMFRMGRFNDFYCSETHIIHQEKQGFVHSRIVRHEGGISEGRDQAPEGFQVMGSFLGAGTLNLLAPLITLLIKEISSRVGMSFHFVLECNGRDNGPES